MIWLAASLPMQLSMSPAGRYKTIPFASCPYPGVNELRRVSQDARTVLTTLAKPSALRSTPVTVQIVVLMSLAGLALKCTELAQAMVSALLQAVESVKNVGVGLLP
jgi:hypothetical protein